MQIRRILTLCFFCLISITTFAQVHLRITSLSRFPVAPNDTAYESMVYDSILVDVQNIGNTILTDNISIYLQSAPANQVDTIYNDTSATYTLQLGSSATIMSNGYRARPIHFDDGDNIVVVWPAARFTPYICDTLSFHVYFVSLVNLIKEQSASSISIGPNPSTNFILVDLPVKNTFKQVRIIDTKGSEIRQLSAGQNYISTTTWPNGIYFIEMIDLNGQKQVKKIVKQ